MSENGKLSRKELAQRAKDLDLAIWVDFATSEYAICDPDEDGNPDPSSTVFKSKSAQCVDAFLKGRQSVV